MANLLLVGNPAKRRKSRKPRTAAQRAATARMLAANRARRGGSAKRRASHTKRRTARKAPTTIVVRSNPVKRHVAKSRARRTRHIRRNPVSSLNDIKSLLMASATGAAGALGVDVLMGVVQPYLPDAVASPNAADGSANYGYYAAKGALAIAASMAASKVIGHNRAVQIAEGSLIVTMHALGSRMIASNAPSVRLGMYPQLGAMPGGKVLPMMRTTRTLRGVGGMGKYLSGDVAQREQVMT